MVRALVEGCIGPVVEISSEEADMGVAEGVALAVLSEDVTSAPLGHFSSPTPFAHVQSTRYETLESDMRYEYSEVHAN